MSLDSPKNPPESHNAYFVNYPKQINAASFSDSDKARFHAKYERRGDHECWFWTSNKQANGYGTMMVGGRAGKPIKAHRIAYELAHGPLADGMFVLHRCDQPDCVNPAHLFSGTQLDNMRDAASKKRLSVPRPGRQKLTDHQCDQIVAAVRAGQTQQSQADLYHVSKCFVSLLVKGKRRQIRKAS